MKIKHLVIIAFLLLVIFLLNSCELVSRFDVAGTWTLSYDWSCTGVSYTAEWYIYEDGTFSDTQANTGTWVLHGSDFTATYSSTGTTYSGTVNDEEMSGTMESGGSTGCWSATKA